MKRLGAFALAVAFLAPAQQAGAQTITTLHSVSVVGVGRVPISPTANPVEADAAYHAALAQAVGDGAVKATTLATEAHARLGSIEAISEGGSSVTCKNAAGEFVDSYKGAEPDSGKVGEPVIGVALAGGVVSPSPKSKKPAKHKKTRRHRRLLAHKAEVSPPASCEISAQIKLIYGLT